MLAALTQADKPVLLVAPPYRVNAPAWQAAGLRLSQLHVLEAPAKDALWAMEQALRAGCCGAVLGWPMQADDQELRRLQVAAEAGNRWPSPSARCARATIPRRRRCGSRYRQVRRVPRNCACSSAAARCRRRAPCPSTRTIDADARVLWACLLLPRLALDAVQRRLTHAQPFALTTGSAAAGHPASAALGHPAHRNAGCCSTPISPRAPPACIRASRCSPRRRCCPTVATLDARPARGRRAAPVARGLGLPLQLEVCLQAEDAMLLEVEGSLGPVRAVAAAEARCCATTCASSASAPHRAGADAARRLRAGRRRGRPRRRPTHAQLQRALARAPMADARLPGGAGGGDGAWACAACARCSRCRARAGAALRRRPAAAPRPPARRGAGPAELYRPPDVFERRIEFDYEMSPPRRRCCSRCAGWSTTSAPTSPAATAACSASRCGSSTRTWR